METTTPSGDDAPEIITFFVARIDVSKSTIDPKYYMNRLSIISENNITDTDAVEKISNFVQESFNMRTVVGAFAGSGFTLYPAKAYYITNDMDASDSYDHDEPTNPGILYTIVHGMYPEIWSSPEVQAEYTKYKEAAAGIKDVLGWDISEYKMITGFTLDDSLPHPKMTYQTVDSLWETAVAIE